MYDELVKRLRNSEHEISCSLCDRDCCYPDGKVHGKCIIIEAADAIEAQDRHILTLQHEMMAEAESHIAEVNQLNKQIEKLRADMRPVVRGKWRPYSPLTDTYECDKCGYQVIDESFRTNFCPSCGADMREPPKEETE